MTPAKTPKVLGWICMTGGCIMGVFAGFTLTGFLYAGQQDDSAASTTMAMHSAGPSTRHISEASLEETLASLKDGVIAKTREERFRVLQRREERLAALERLKVLDTTGEHRAALIPLLHDPDTAIRWNAVNMLGETKDRTFAPQVAELLDADESPSDFGTSARAAAARVLGNMRATEYAPKLAQLMQDANALLAQHPPFHEPACNYEVHYGYQLLRESVWGLVKMDAKEFSPDIARLLTDRSKFIRCNAAWALGELRATEFQPGVATLLQDRADMHEMSVTIGTPLSVRECAANALRRMRELNLWERIWARWDPLRDLGMERERVPPW